MQQGIVAHKRPAVAASFPVDGVLDTFTQADGALSANWACPLGTASTVVSNRLQSPAGPNDSGCFWVAATFTQNEEAYVTIPTVSGTWYARVYLRTTTGSDGYFVVVGSDNVASINRADTDATVASGTQAFAGGDSLGIEAIGNTIKLWYKSGAGSWTTLLTATDSTFNGAVCNSGGCYIGIYLQNSATAITADNFGGGNR